MTEYATLDGYLGKDVTPEFKEHARKIHDLGKSVPKDRLPFIVYTKIFSNLFLIIGEEYQEGNSPQLDQLGFIALDDPSIDKHDLIQFFESSRKTLDGTFKYIFNTYKSYPKPQDVIEEHIEKLFVSFMLGQGIDIKLIRRTEIASKYKQN